MSRAQAMARYPEAGHHQAQPGRSRWTILALVAGSGALLYYLSGRRSDGAAEGGTLCARCRGQLDDGVGASSTETRETKE